MVLRSNGTTQDYLYLHRDYQGTILAISNALGAVVEKRLFDAWGQLLKVQDGKGNVFSKMMILDRGYTGHEHIQSVGLVHMNGRLYDAKLHRFLQPDNFVQDPFNTQNFNRYGYVLNNPLRYIDPTGEWGLEWLIGAAVVVVFTYVKGAHDNKSEDGAWQWNPTKWEEIPTVSVGTNTDLSSPNYTTNATLYVTPTQSNTPLGIGGTQFDLSNGNNPKANTIGGNNGGDGIGNWDLNNDSKLQKYEADSWGMNHGTDITVDGNKIDLIGFNKNNTGYDKNTGIYSYPTTKMFSDLPYETAATYGGSVFKLVNGQYQMQTQLYHYNMRPWNSIENVGRNLATQIGYPTSIIHTPKGAMPTYKVFRPYTIIIKY